MTDCLEKTLPESTALDRDVQNHKSFMRVGSQIKPRRRRKK